MNVSVEEIERRLNDPSNVVNRLLDLNKPKRPAPPAVENGRLEDAQAGIIPLAPGDKSDSASEEGGPLPSFTKLGSQRTDPIVEEGKSEVVEWNGKGKRKGATTLTDEEREVIGTLAPITGQAKAAAIFNVSQPTASIIENQKGKRDKEVAERVERNLGRVRDVALDRLLSSLNLLDDDKLEKLDAKELSVVSSNMSRVVEKTLPKEVGPTVNAQLIVYAPTLAKEEHYPVIELEDASI